jgi:hypothetical protein
MSINTFSSPQPGGDDFNSFHVSLPAASPRSVMIEQLSSLLDKPRAFEEAIEWHLRENEREVNNQIKLEKNELLCEVLHTLQIPFTNHHQAESNNQEHANLLLVSSCSVIQHFALNSEIVDPFPSRVYDLLNSVFQLITVNDQEYRTNPTSRRHLEQGLSFLSPALSLDRDVGRWVPNSNEQPTRTRIAQFLDKAFEQAVESELPNQLPEENIVIELSLLNEEIKIAGALRLFEGGESLPILMRRVIAWQSDIDQQRAIDSEIWGALPDTFDYGLEDSPWAESERLSEIDPNSLFIESELLGSLVDSYGRIVAGIDRNRYQDEIVEDQGQIYSLLVSHQPNWPAWPLCLRGYLKLSNDAVAVAREILQDSLIESLTKSEIRPQVLQKFISNDWEAEELLCHVVKQLPFKKFISLRTVIEQDQIIDKITSTRFADKISALYFRKRESYYSQGFGL